MAYVAEGLGKFLDWNEVVAYQRKNGSFFNSPSTTAAAAIHNCDPRAHEYLDSVISLFGSSGEQQNFTNKIVMQTRWCTETLVITHECSNGYLQSQLCIHATFTTVFGWWMH